MTVNNTTIGTVAAAGLSLAALLLRARRRHAA